MKPTTHLVVAVLLFLGTHYVASTPLRGRLVSVLGKGYLGLYSLTAFVTLGYMMWAYYHAPFVKLWYSPALRYAPLVIMPFALFFFVTGLLTRNPTMVQQEGLLRSIEPARGILRVTRHPLMWSFALWGVAHLLARGDAAAALFFGAFVLLALSGTVLIDRRKSSLGDDWQRFAAVTSNVPFAAIAHGRNRFDLAEIGWAKIGIALVLYVVLLVAHPVLFGARPF